MSLYTAVIPVHNGAATILDALSSLALQTIPPDKILIFNNCSNDSTLEEIQKFKRNSEIPIEVQHSDRLLPPHESFASSIKNVEGRFIWLAADDILFPWSVEKLLAARCSLSCNHSLSGSSLFLNDKGKITRGKSFERHITPQSFLRDPADNAIFYGMHVSQNVRGHFPKVSFHAWDWYFSFFCIKSGTHISTPFPIHLREYTPIASHRSSASSQAKLAKYFPYIGLSKSILMSLSLREKLQTMSTLVILNVKGFLVFGKFSRKFEEANTYERLRRLRKSLRRPMHFARENSIIRRIYGFLPEPAQTLVRRVGTKKENEFVIPQRELSKLFDEVNLDNRSRLLSIHNPISDLYCIPTKKVPTSHVLEMIKYFLCYADKQSKLVIDTRFTAVNLDFLKTILVGFQRLLPNGRIIFGPIRKRVESIQDIEEFYSQIWAADFNRDLDKSFSKVTLKKKLERLRVNIFFAEIPQPNRDAGSIDAFYVLNILKRLGVKTNVYLPHLVTDNPIALATLREFANTDLVANFDDVTGINIVYGPYAYQNFASLVVQSSFIYIMVDAVFRRADQNKGTLSLSDRYVLDFETEALQNCRYALAISEKDRDAVINKFPNTNTLLFPIIRFPRNLSYKEVMLPQNLLFIGSLVHTPNRIAAEWIVKELAPKLLMVNPKIQLVLAGKGSEEFNRVYSNVRGLGLVADLNSLYAESFATIAPMEVAAGVNGKVIESLCFQRPAIISEAVSFNLPRGLLKYCEIAVDADDYAYIADEIYKGSKDFEKTSWNMEEVNGKSNIETLKKLLEEWH
jgi:glycosyltransferase involved in cell wall biosynthesis